MKKFLIAAVVAVMSLAANAQNEVGTFTVTPNIGLGVSFFSDTQFNLSNGGTIKAKAYSNQSLGVDFKYQAAKNFQLSAGVNFVNYNVEPTKEKVVMTLGNSTVTKEERFDLNLMYVGIPVMARYNIGKFGIMAGVQPSFMIAANNNLDNVNANYKKFQLYIPVGVTYNINKKCELGLKYTLPTSKFNKGDANSKAHAVLLTLGYNFNL